MNHSERPTQAWPIIGVLLAIGITTTMDLTGLAMFSALPLLPLLGLFWYLQRFGRVEMGFVWGRPWHYGLAILYPLVVLGLAVLIALVSGATNAAEINWQNLGKNLLLMSLMGPIVLVLTEEGFFRGWLRASLSRAGHRQAATLVWSSLAFAAWHWTWAVLEDGLGLRGAQIGVYLSNAAMMGAVWGMLRLISGSIVVASVSHAVWNAIAYTLFGAGPITGALGIDQKFVFGAEVGLIGLALNVAFGVVLWKWWQGRSSEPR